MEGNFFAEQRERLRLTQKQIADALGYESYAAVSAWERDIAAPDSDNMDELDKLARVYKVSRAKIIEETMSLRFRVKAKKKAEKEVAATSGK